MKANKLYSVIKPYMTMGAVALCLTTFNVNSQGYNDEKNINQAKYSDYQKGHSNHQQRMKKRFRMMAMQLDLTKEQRQQVRDIFAATKVDKKERREAMSGFKEQVKSLAQDSEFNEDKFKAIYAEFQLDFQNIAMEKAKMRHAVFQVLTPEQQEKFASLREQRGALFQ